MKHSMHPSLAVFAGAALTSAMLVGCGAETPGRPVPLLSAADRAPDADCDETWVAAITGRVTDLDGRAIAGAHFGACLIGGGSASCLAPVTTDANGWAEVTIARHLRCVSRAVVRVAPRAGAYAITYQTLELTPERAVLDVPEDFVVVPVRSATSGATLSGLATDEHVVRFEGDLTVTVRPSALEDPSVFGGIAAVVLDGADAPPFLHGAGEPVLAIGLAPDSELSTAASFSLGAPRGAREGETFELFVLGGLYTPLADGRVVEEGELARFGTATVRSGRLETDPGVGLPRMGWIVVR